MNWEMIVLPAIIGAFVAMIFNLAGNLGDNIIARLFDRRVKREQERDGDLAEFRQIILEVRDLAIKYWMSDFGDPETITNSASIVGRIAFATSINEEIFGGNRIFYREMQILLIVFINSCTSGNFDSEIKNREPDRCRAIEISAYRLIHRAISLRRKL